MAKLTEFTIRRSEWLRGSSINHANGCLLRQPGLRCCVGFFASQVVGLSDYEISGVRLLEDVERVVDAIDGRTRQTLRNELARIYSVNDSAGYTDKQREALLTSMFKKHGYLPVFVD